MLSKNKEAGCDHNVKWNNSKKKKKKKEQARKNRKRIVRRNRKYVEAHKLKNPCPCEEKTPCCLSFHHKNGDKDANISDMVNRGYGIRRIQTEIEKCEVLCLNCHARLHMNCKEALKKEGETKGM